jgi:cysteine-rich repeat protein
LANDSYLTNYSETWQFTTLPNEPPNAPSNPLFYSTLFPPGSNQVSGNGYTNAPLSGDRIFWSGSDPNGDSLTYDVYFGTTQASLPLVSTQASTQYNIPGTLLPNTVYYWKIVANDSLNTTAGPVWSFTTRNERAPTVSLAYPSNSQTGVSLSVTLQWSQADADSDPITPTVFFGTDPNALNGYSASDSSRSFFGLSPLTTYYWYVNVSDGMMSSKSSTWSFTTRSTPPLPPTSVCGNGVIEGGEQCDGSAPSGFTCQSCQLVGVGAVCGNTIIEAGEQCDSSAPAGYSCISCRLYANSNDTNTTQCGNNKLEVGEQCDGSAPAGYVCMNCKLQVNGTVCGNLVVEIGEQCDGSAPTNFVCIDCSLIPLNTPVCGNSILEYPEQCDGSAPPGLTCTNCVLVDLNVTPVCGNSIVEPPESCDGSAPAGYTCVTCQLVPIVVPNPVCGNNIVESPETCDGYAPPGFTCDACTLKSIQAVCGNSVTEWGEECDLGNLNGVPNSGCTVDCLSTVVLEPLPTTVCGDGKREGGEACDDGNVVNGDGCSYLCSWESVCGNSIVEAGEQCDDGNTLGGDGCSYACTLETRQPFRPDQGDRSDGLNRGGGQSGNNYVWIWEWDAGTGAMVRKQVRELGSIFRCATNPAAANCGGLTAFLVGNTRYETVNGVTSTIQDYICLDPSTNVTLFTWGVNEASCPSELYAADVNRDGQSDVVTFGGIYDVSQKVLLQQFTGHTSNDIMIPLQLYSDGSLSVIFSSNQSNTVGVYQSGSTSIDGIDTQSGLSVNPDSQKIDIVVPEMTTSTCSADVFYNVEGEWKLCTRIQNIGCGYITAADGSWCGCGDYQVNVTAREVLTGVVTRYSFEQTVPTTQCEQVVVASNRCSIAPDGEFNFHDDVTFHGWSSNAMVVGSTYTPSAKIQTDGKYAYMLNGAQIEHELNSCEYTQLDVEANIGIVSEIGYNFGVNIYGRTTKKTSALIGGFVLLDNELPNSTDANPLVETPNYANLYVYDVSATRADSSLIPVAYVPSVAECGGSTSLSGGLKLQVVAGQDASADIKFTDSDGLSGSLRINVGDTETLTMNSVDYEISLLSNSNGQYSFVVNGEAVVVQAKDPNVACLRRLRLSLDLMTRSYSIEYEYAPGEFQMLSRSVPFASQDIVGFNAVVVENRFNPNNPMGSLVVVDYVRTLGGEGIVDEELLRDETRRAKEYAFSMLDTCSSEGTLDDEYQKLVGHCTAMNSVGLTTSVYCGIDMLRDAVYYNRDCYKGALKYCQMVTFAKTNGMTSPDSVNAVGDLPQQDSLEGSLGCSTALMVGASNDALLQPIWNTVSRILWKNIWTVAVIALLVMLWAMGRQGGRQ